MKGISGRPLKLTNQIALDLILVCVFVRKTEGGSD